MPQAHFEPTWAHIARSGGYPTQPAVGKPEMILNTNSTTLYHRFSPYSNYSQNGGFLNWGDQPFYYVYIDQSKTFPNHKTPQSQVLPIQNSIIDVQRVSKFLVSGTGVSFLATQFLLQTGNAFDETRIYNPTSPIVAAGMGLTLGSVRPQRFIDTSNILQSLLGPAGGLLGGSSITPPKSTTGKLALPDVNASTDGKGLLRGGDANKGLANFKSKWAPSQGGTNSFMSAVAGIASSLFANFIPARQDGIQFRSDEGSYGMMLAGASPRFDYVGNSGTTFGFGQIWVGGTNGQANIRKKGEYTIKPYRLFVDASNGIVNKPIDTSSGLNGSIPTVGTVGYTPTDKGAKPGFRYEDAMKPSINKNFDGSDVMYQYKSYADKAQLFPTKNPEKNIDSPNKLNESLNAILTNIKAASGGFYSSTVADGVILSNGATKFDYDTQVFDMRDGSKRDKPKQFKFGALAAYRKSNVKMVSDELVDGAVDKSLKLPTAGRFDTLNTLHVLDKSKKDKETGTTWDAFRDDLIGLYFYDVVNEKYIPFRAAVKGVAESANASWEETPFIGRADKVYYYGGFNRNLTFNLRVVISSLAELAPTWQRINYMMTSYKPANYTRKNSPTGGDLVYDRFMVPPMFMLTMGDLYRDQPILIQSMTMTIPDDASWETLNKENNGYQWSYMANTIKAPDALFGQVPREVELGITAILLEKERAVVGGANFGHAPRTEQFGEWNEDTVPDSKAINAWNTNYVTEIPNLG